MGDDGETFSSNFNKPSFEEASEQHSIEEEKLNYAEECEFVPKSDDSNVSPFTLKESEGLSELGTQMVAKEETAVQAGIQGTVEDKMGAEAVVGGGDEAFQGGDISVTEEGPVLEANMKALTENVGGGNSDFSEVDKTVMDEEGHMEALAEQAGPVVATEGVKAVVDTVDLQAVATAGDREKNDSDTGSFVGKSDDTVVDEAVAVVEGENPIPASDNLQPTDSESVTVEEDAKMVVMPVESSLVVTGAEKEQESAEDKEAIVEEILSAEVKVDAGTSIEVTEETKAENVNGLQGLQFVGSESPKLAKEEMNRMGGINDQEGLVADTEMDDIKGTEELKISLSNDLQFDGHESVIMISNEANKERLPDEIPTAENELEKGKEAVEVGDVESIPKPDDANFVQQDEKYEQMVAEEFAVADTGMETETDVGEEWRLLGIGKEAETRGVEVGDVVSIPMIDDAKLVPKDEEVKEMVAQEESPLAGTEMETETDVGEERRLLGLEKGKEAETEAVEVGVESIPKINDAKLVTQDEEDEEVVAEEESALAGTEMETETDVGEKRRLLGLEKGREAETETGEVGDVESIPRIDDAKLVPQDEEDEEMVAEEESALVDTEMETETDVGESSKAVGEKQKRGRNSKILMNSKTVSKAQKIMDEDVCFICFDGGDLVLCDRR